MGEWYQEFVDLSYVPNQTDLICLFRVTPASGFTIEQAAGRVASESSVGTWTELTTMKPRIRRLMAKAFWIEPPHVKVAYPLSIFEPGSMPQILSSIAGNVFGMKAVEGLRLEDIQWPREILRSFRGPQHGIHGVRRILGVKRRPITATVPKPKVGLTAMEHARAGYEAWTGGIDLLKDDENLSSQKFNKFEKRVHECYRARDKAESETGERKSCLINITAETREMIRRARLIAKAGGEFAMIDFLTAGWGAFQTAREECEDLDLAIHAHRAFHAAFTRNRSHGMSMLAVSDAVRLVGADHLHIGAVVGKLESPREEVLQIRDNLQFSELKEGDVSLPQNWGKIKPVIPTISGGLHPGLIPEVLNLFGNDVIIQAGGGVWGHPMGGTAGAKAVRQSIDAAISGMPIQDYAKDHPELLEALQRWGVSTYI